MIYVLRYRKHEDDPLTEIPFGGIMPMERAHHAAAKLERQGFCEVTVSIAEREMLIRNLSSGKTHHVTLSGDTKPRSVMRSIDCGSVLPKDGEHIRVEFRLLGELEAVYQCWYGKHWVADPTAVRQERIHKGDTICSIG